MRESYSIIVLRWSERARSESMVATVEDEAAEVEAGRGGPPLGPGQLRLLRGIVPVGGFRLRGGQIGYVLLFRLDLLLQRRDLLRDRQSLALERRDVSGRLAKRGFKGLVDGVVGEAKRSGRAL